MIHCYSTIKLERFNITECLVVLEYFYINVSRFVLRVGPRFRLISRKPLILLAFFSLDKRGRFHYDSDRRPAIPLPDRKRELQWLTSRFLPILPSQTLNGTTLIRRAFRKS